MADTSSRGSARPSEDRGRNQARRRLGHWRDELIKLGYTVGPVDTTSNPSAPKIIIELFDPFALHLVARPTSSNARVSLNFNSSSAATRRLFLAAASDPSLLDHLKDRTLKTGGGGIPYFYLARHTHADDFMVEPVAAAITALKGLVGRS